jgi:hypothetical protein
VFGEFLGSVLFAEHSFQGYPFGRGYITLSAFPSVEGKGVINITLSVKKAGRELAPSVPNSDSPNGDSPNSDSLDISY